MLGMLFGGQLLILNTMSYATLYQPFEVHQVVHERALGLLGLALSKAHLGVYVFLQTFVQRIPIDTFEK